VFTIGPYTFRPGSKILLNQKGVPLPLLGRADEVIE